MTPSEGSFYRPLVWSLSTALAACGLLLMIQMIAAVIGPFRFAELGARDPHAQLGLWLAAASPEQGASPARPWRALLAEWGVVRDVPSLAALDPAELGVVVLPEPRTLDAEQALQIERYLAAGGGVVLTGAVGVRDARGAWRGFDLMQRLLGGVPVMTLDAEQAGALVAARRGPLSALLAPAARLLVQPEPGMPGLAGIDAELCWVPASAGERSGGAPAASLRRTLGGGRLVWLAAGPERARPGADDAAALHALLEAAVAWTARRPVVEVLAWPGGAPFAAALEARPASSAGGTLARELADEIAAAQASAGLARLSVPDDAAGASRATPAVEEALAELARRSAWLATRSQLSAWTRQRSSIEATLRRAGPQRLVVAVTNRAERAVGDVVLRVHLNQTTLRASVATTALGQPAPSLRFRSGADSLDLALPELPARRSAAFTLDYEPLADG